MKKKVAIAFSIVAIILLSMYALKFYRASQIQEYKSEQISTVNINNEETSVNSIDGNLTLNKILSKPNNIILTGVPEHRLVTIYKTNKLI